MVHKETYLTGEGLANLETELEHLRSAQKRRDGIEVEDATWERLRSLAEEYGLSGELGLE